VVRPGSKYPSISESRYLSVLSYGLGNSPACLGQAFPDRKNARPESGHERVSTRFVIIGSVAARGLASRDGRPGPNLVYRLLDHTLRKRRNVRSRPKVLHQLARR